MATFTPKMLRDLLESQDPKDQELARQLSDLEFSNETGRLANYPPPAPPAMPVVPETIQPPTNVGGPTPMQLGLMEKANRPRPQPVAQPAQPVEQELQPNSFRNERTGEVTKLSGPQPQPSGTRILDQMQQKDGSIFQLIEQETPRGMVRTTRVVVPDAVNPAKIAEAKYAKTQAEIEQTRADTERAKRPVHYQPVMKDIVDPSDPTRMIAVDVNTYKGGSLGAPGVVAVSGKEPSSAKRQETVQAGLESFQTLTSGLRSAYNTLKENGDIASSDKNAGANALNALQSSGLGQFTGKVVGTKSQDERNAITSSKQILLQSIMQATGMTARQLDSNVELKMWINSITDPSNTYESNMKILDNIEKFVSTKANAISKLNSGREQPASNADKAQLLFEAHKAIARGAPKDVVRQRLQSMGITNAGI